MHSESLYTPQRRLFLQFMVINTESQLNGVQSEHVWSTQF